MISITIVKFPVIAGYGTLCVDFSTVEATAIVAFRIMKMVQKIAPIQCHSIRLSVSYSDS